MTSALIKARRRHVAELVTVEIERQVRVCAEKQAEGLRWFPLSSPTLTSEEKFAAISEEVGEIARELCDARAEQREPARNLVTELVQLAALSSAWLELIA